MESDREVERERERVEDKDRMEDRRWRRYDKEEMGWMRPACCVQNL